MGHKLILRFTTVEDGKYFTLTLENIKVDIVTGLPAVTVEQVNTLMNLIIQKGVFYSTSGALVAKKDAKVVSTTSQEFSVL